MSHPSFQQILADARSLLHEDEIETVRESIDRLKVSCLEDPMLLYPKALYKPRFVVWELTLRCNMRCAHCGSSAGTRRGNELNTEEALDLAAQLGALGCERLTLLGGEPLIREDWEEITRALQDAGVRVNIITNGWLTASAEMIQRIKDAGLTTLALSIDGFGDKHDELRRKQGSFDRILKTFDLANKLRIPRTAAVTTLTKLCMDDLEDIYQMLIDKNVRLWQLQPVSPQGRLERNDPIVLEAQDYKRVADFIVEKKKEGKIRIDPADNLGYYGPWELSEGFRSTQWGRVGFWNGCQAGIQVAGIDANGDIKGCLSLTSDDPSNIEGNIRDKSLEEIWCREGAFAYNREFKLEMLEDYCAECEYRGLCRAGCVSHCQSMSGSRRSNPDCLHRFQVKGEI
jgi:radical SAM protein with 4Fe4S-binding SPASM domain